ncbi:TPM domain-containing protein [Bacteroidales bacterium OttesenSCG-928-L03]|nr:TPM domain-containing protein [Bacteroidales bacterium OttesenSCG-928-L03]
MKQITITLLFLLFPLVFWAQEYTVKSIPNPKAANVANYVSNPDGILTTTEVSEINALLGQLEAESKAEVAVVLLNSIGNEDIKSFAVDLFEEWGIGKAKVDNGLLILFILDQRAITFEVGYGLEGVVTDAMSKRIQTQAMLPYFRQGNYGQGIIEGVKRVGALIREEPVPELEEKKIDWNEILPIAIAAYILWALLAFVWTSVSVNKTGKDQSLKTNKERYTQIKHQLTWINTAMMLIFPILLIFFLSFILGSVAIGLLAVPLALAALPAVFYGLGAKRRIRRAPIPCPGCGTDKMEVLSEKEDNAYLTASQDMEEKLHSVDYDVFLCKTCHKTVVYPYDNPSSPYKKCSKCGTKALEPVRTYTLRQPSYSQTGIKRTEYRCRFCGNEENHDQSIPKLERTVVVAGGLGAGGRSGGFGGGSFGGGLSGGGGATSRW